MEIGSRYKVLRENRGLTQKDVAQRIGQVYQAVARFETPGHNPNWNQIVAMLSAIDVSPAEFFESRIPVDYAAADRSAHELLQEILESGDETIIQSVVTTMYCVKTSLDKLRGRSTMKRNQAPRTAAGRNLKIRKVR